MRSFIYSLSFLLSFFLLPLHPAASSDPAVILVFAHAADIKTNFRASQNLKSQDSVNYRNASEVDRLSQKDGNEEATGSTAAASYHGLSNANPQLRRRHTTLSRPVSNATGRDKVGSVGLYPGKRATGAQFTNYVTGLGACGGFNKASDFVVALNIEQWDNGAHCYAPITITIKGKSVQAQIVDSCERCGFNNLDMTDGLFSVWADINTGTLEGEWEYGNGAPPPPPPPPPPPKTTSVPPPKPTTSQVPTASHSTKTSTTKISTSTAATSSSTSSSASASTTTTGSPAQPSQTEDTLELLYLASLGISGILLSSLN